METRKVTPFPDDILRNLAVMKAAHARLARPSSLGRVIGVPGRTEMPDAIQATGTRH
jgi:acyl-CoA thioester hydrolase